MDKQELLKLGAKELGVELTNDMIDKLFIYMHFLKEYNKKVNLTSIIEDTDIIIKHFLDSISILQYIDIKKEQKIIDIGTGAGFPGVVLKIVADNLQLTLVDSTRKKITFLEELFTKISISEITCIHARAEELCKHRLHNAKYDYCVSRAVSRLAKLSEYCLPYIKPGGLFLAMKGRNYNNELKDAMSIIKQLGCELEETKEIPLPFSSSGKGEIVHAIVKIRKI